MAWGFEVGDGWAPIILRMVARMDALRPRPTLAQVKEKWGTLRVYTDGGPVAPLGWRWLAVPFLWAWHVAKYRRGPCGWTPRHRWYCARETLRPEDPTSRIVADAERESESVCEDCGEPGRLREGGYVLTLCDACEAKRGR